MYPLKLHKSLNSTRWESFSLDQQLLMIGNEMNRLISGLQAGRPYLDQKACMERAFELIDLTISLGRKNLQRELLRWRGLLAMVYLMPESEFNRQTDYLKQLFKTLLFLNPKSALVPIN